MTTLPEHAAEYASNVAAHALGAAIEAVDSIKTPNDEARRSDAAGGLSGGADCSAAARRKIICSDPLTYGKSHIY